jgi:hypothetical protein
MTNIGEPRTDRARFQFSAREYRESNHIRYLKIEPIDSDLDALDGMLGFDLLPGTTSEQARVNTRV